MYKNERRHLTPYQQVELDIREASNDPSTRIMAKRAGDRASRPLEQQSHVDAGETGPTDDDLAPETLIHEDGARSPYEEGDDIPADRSYRVVRRDEAGGTYGLDEAELARIDPLDGEPWDGDEEDSDEEE